MNQGFDPRMSGKHGTVYGFGTYFARDAKFSNGFTGSFTTLTDNLFECSNDVR